MDQELTTPQRRRRLRLRAGSILLAVSLVACAPATPVDTTLASSALEAAIRGDLLENFGTPGDASWYPSIKTVTIEGPTLVMGTDLAPGSSMASDICSAVSNYVFANTADPSLTAVEVRGAGGQILVRRTSVGDACPSYPTLPPPRGSVARAAHDDPL